MADKWMPIILPVLCTGCGLCVEACGPRSLAMDEDKAVLAFPDTCGSEEHCISACPEDAIQMSWQPFSGDRSTGRWNDERAATATRHNDEQDRTDAVNILVVTPVTKRPEEYTEQDTMG